MLAVQLSLYCNDACTKLCKADKYNVAVAESAPRADTGDLHALFVQQ